MRFAVGAMARHTLVLLLGLATVTAHADEQLLRDAQALLNSGQFERAVALLSPAETELAGNSRFDYMLGLALLETGQSGRATFALERAIAVDPGFAAARLDLARAYYKEGRLELSRQELIRLRDQNPPPAARIVINNLLASIDSRLQPDKNQYEAYVHLGTGYDSNANAATDASRFLGFILDPDSRETDSIYASYGGGARVQHPLSEGLVWDSRGDLLHRDYPDASFVNTTLASVRTMLQRVDSGSSLAGGLTAYRLNTDGHLNNQGISLESTYQRDTPAFFQWSLSGKVTAVRYEDDQDVRDVNQLLLGGALSRSFGAQSAGNYGGGVLLGRDQATRSDSRYSRNLYGLRLFGGWNFSEAVRLQTIAGIGRSDYDDVFFPQDENSDRRDTLSQVTLSLSWQINPRWLLRYSYSHQHNHSNVDIFSYTRDVGGISVTRVWR